MNGLKQYNLSFCNRDGDPLACDFHIYSAGTSNPATTYGDDHGTALAVSSGTGVTFWCAAATVDVTLVPADSDNIYAFNSVSSTIHKLKVTEGYVVIDDLISTTTAAGTYLTQAAGLTSATAASTYLTQAAGLTSATAATTYTPLTGCLRLLSSTAVNLNAAQDTVTDLYTVPAAKTFVPVMVVLRGLSASAGSATVTLGQKDGTVAEFLSTQTLSGANGATKVAILQPIPAATTNCVTVLAATKIFSIKLTAAAGSAATCTADVFGYTY